MHNSIRQRLLRLPRILSNRLSRLYSSDKFTEMNSFGIVLSRDLFESHEPEISNYVKSKSSFYPSSVLSDRIIDYRNPYKAKNEMLRRLLEYDQDKIPASLNTRLHKFQLFLEPEFTLLSREALIMTCGLSDSYYYYGGNDFYKSDKLRHMGKLTYNLTKELLLIFGDLQYLATPLEDLQDVLDILGQDGRIIPEFMKRASLYDVVIPFRGALRYGSLDAEDSKSLSTKIRNSTAIGSFHTMIGLLVVKYGKEEVVEKFLVPRVFNGESGIIGIISEIISEKRQ